MCLFLFHSFPLFVRNVHARDYSIANRLFFTNNVDIIQVALKIGYLRRLWTRKIRSVTKKNHLPAVCPCLRRSKMGFKLDHFVYCPCWSFKLQLATITLWHGAQRPGNFSKATIYNNQPTTVCHWQCQNSRRGNQYCAKVSHLGFSIKSILNQANIRQFYNKYQLKALKNFGFHYSCNSYPISK